MNTLYDIDGDSDNILNYDSIFTIKTDDIDETDEYSKIYKDNTDNKYNTYIKFGNEIDDSDSNNKRKNILPKNKAFMILHEDFVMNGWNLITNRNDYLVYTKDGYNCDEFIISIKSKNNIQVTVPMSNSNICYRTSFNNYFSACEFVSMHLKLYEEKNYNTSSCP